MTVLNVGVIGTGMAFEKLHYPAFKELADKYRIAALCDKDLEKALYWAGIVGLDRDSVYRDYGEMLKRGDIDVYDIMVPITLNYRVTEEVARSIAGTGKGIITEKPSATNLDDARAHRDLPAKYNVLIMVAENYRYNEETNIIREMVAGGRIGSIFHFIHNRVLDFPGDMLKDKFPAKEWRQYPQFPGGAFLDSGIHDLAALRHIFGAVERVHAFGRPQEEGFSPYSTVQANILFNSGITGQFTFFCAGREAQTPFIGLRIFGTEGMIFLEERDCGTINIAYNSGDKETIAYTPQRGYYNELLNIYNALTNKEPLFVTPEVGYGDTKMALDILSSIEKGTVIGPVDERDDEGEPRPQKKSKAALAREI